jgi:hypothetical protein
VYGGAIYSNIHVAVREDFFFHAPFLRALWRQLAEEERANDEAGDLLLVVLCAIATEQIRIGTDATCSTGANRPCIK